ncbi:hypothetical protein AeMF1_001244 [Aphanomyces euteiches]|nr:hypothetical protein AeMF1_001244 [Aphanomyces euteiches]KAH9191490.1 hypothetical protein AeNC1_006533 [Aphanomyces euteiches]
MAAWVHLLGATLQTKTQGDVAVEHELAGKTVVGLYFSALWCSPCQEFTPVLTATYDKVKSAHPDFELVYVSSDQSQDQFDEAYAKLPFPALPFADRRLKAALVERFNVPWVPFVVFLNADGEVIERDGRRRVVSARSPEALWTELTTPRSSANA